MAGKTKAKKPRPATEPEDVLTLTDLRQVRVLADPLRLSLLRCFLEERTTKQAAAQLGLPPTRLYHHVAALERAGFVRRTRTRQNRGALEKYFLVTARTIVADPRVFDATLSPADREALRDVASSTLHATARELERMLARSPRPLPGEAILTFLEIEATEPELRRLRTAFERVLRMVVERETKRGRAAAKKEPPRRRHRLLVALFPLE